MVRGALPLMNFMFIELFQEGMKWSLIQSGIATGAIIIVIAIVAALFTEETFKKDLNYVEM
jgi:hypothetical protein